MPVPRTSLLDDWITFHMISELHILRYFDNIMCTEKEVPIFINQPLDEACHFPTEYF